MLSCIIFYFLFEQHMTKPHQDFQKLLLANQQTLFLVGTFVAENRNFSLLQNDNSTSLLPDLISTDIFCFIVSIDSMRSF